MTDEAPRKPRGSPPSWLEDAWNEGRRENDGIVVPLEAFASYVTSKSVSRASNALRVAELYLACACAAQSSAAIARFEQRYFPVVGRALRRLKVAESVIDDLEGSLREKLFFGDSTSPQKQAPWITDYSGVGPLESWLRTIAVRAALKVVRRNDRNVELDDRALDDMDRAPDPELLYLRKMHAPQIEAAIERAMATLSTRERTLVRQHYLEAMGIDAIGKHYGVHRATAARWLAALRVTIARQVRESLAIELSLGDEELESLVRYAARDLDFSVGRLVAAPKVT
ncbi:hypothetical protein [Labilithrix luteola]|uniref:hypothetical protein n=1 Tax=Labilithrix luteola TaxID=1391654 RepID=UPI001472E9CF|nr:hypothetical protein [Labilithrix luteola]